ncbi:MAG: hypothetical protein Q7R56_03435 [Nanoarchaeota archaeon]|nr:hypothetical protein [Nanoarchaeota archaeon]
MASQNVRIDGILKSMTLPVLVTRAESPDLLHPEQFFSTRVEIDQEEGASSSLEVMGVVPANYIGKTVSLREFHHSDENNDLFRQELYVEGRRVGTYAVIRSKK